MRKIKDYICIEFNKVLSLKKWKNCKDSTSALTTSKHIIATGDNKTQFSIDVAIVYKSKENFHRLIHEKTGNVSKDEWIWNKARNSNKLNEKNSFIKKIIGMNYVKHT